jgi:hypothetical protein
MAVPQSAAAPRLTQKGATQIVTILPIFNETKAGRLASNIADGLDQGEDEAVR